MPVMGYPSAPHEMGLGTPPYGPSPAGAAAESGGRSRIPVVLLVSAIVLAATIGLVSATDLTLQSGGTQSASGWSGTVASINGWAWERTAFENVTATETTASTAVGSPTALPLSVLPGSATYGANTTVRGDRALYFDFLLNTTLAGDTEFEVHLTIGLQSPGWTGSVYFETPITGLLNTVSLTLIWDSGSTSLPSTLTLGGYQITVSECSAIGTCG
jgi:hypothetical protein